MFLKQNNVAEVGLEPMVIKPELLGAGFIGVPTQLAESFMDSDPWVYYSQQSRVILGLTSCGSSSLLVK